MKYINELYYDWDLFQNKQGRKEWGTDKTKLIAIK